MLPTTYFPAASSSCLVLSLNAAVCCSSWLASAPPRNLPILRPSPPRQLRLANPETLSSKNICRTLSIGSHFADKRSTSVHLPSTWRLFFNVRSANTASTSRVSAFATSVDPDGHCTSGAQDFRSLNVKSFRHGSLWRQHRQRQDRSGPAGRSWSASELHSA